MQNEQGKLLEECFYLKMVRDSHAGFRWLAEEDMSWMVDLPTKDSGHEGKHKIAAWRDWHKIQAFPVRSTALRATPKGQRVTETSPKSASSPYPFTDLNRHTQ